MTSPFSSLLDSSIHFTSQITQQKNACVINFVSSVNFEDQLSLFCQLVKLRTPVSKATFIHLLNTQIACLDDLMNEQVNAIMHHKKYQALEASWRGLHYLVSEADDVENVKIKFLDVSWSQLTRDLERAIEFDQSQLFRKVYNAEFGTAGGEPYSVLLGDYTIR
ncbi:MAG TPA: type VI secretion system contractile sheath large subunit, partial [Gammaproteobacteria bacterium]|nr:type VI secretion system contractile sheath large subunit [Gammaproteobacteria bacterium]